MFDRIASREDPDQTSQKQSDLALPYSGFPQALEIMENLENHKKSSMHGKIIEFEKT